MPSRYGEIGTIPSWYGKYGTIPSRYCKLECGGSGAPVHGGKIPCAERELAGNCRPSCLSSLGLLFADGAKMSGQNGHSSSFFGAMSAPDARNEVVIVARDNHIFPTKKEF